MARGRSLLSPVDSAARAALAGRVAAVVGVCCVVIACNHDWDSYDVRLGPDAGVGASGAGSSVGAGDDTGTGVTSTSTGSGGASTASSMTTGPGGSTGSGGSGGGACGTPTDSKNCGLCGHDCLGGTCSGGFCQPMTIGMGSKPIGVVLTSTEVYWSDQAAGTITVSAKDGSNGSVYAQQTSVRYLATDPLNLYWPIGGTIRRRALAGGPITDLVTGANMWGIAIVGNEIYFTESDQGLFKAPKSGGASTAVDLPTMVMFAEGVASASGIVYWADNLGTISAYDAQSGMSVPFVTGEPGPAGVCVFDSVVYWTNQGSGELRSRPTDGGATETLVDGLQTPAGVAVDKTAIYWAESGSGLVRRVAR